MGTIKKNQTKPHILLVGTFHMNDTADLLKIDYYEESDLERLLERLTSFRATKVAVEVEVKNDHSLNRHYKQYVNGERELAHTEVEKIGFQLAARSNHKEIYAIDWMENIGQRSIGDVLEAAKKSNPDIYEKIFIISIYLTFIKTYLVNRFKNYLNLSITKIE